MLRALANSAIHPSEVGKWVVIHVLGNCGSIVRYAGYGRRNLRRGTAAIADQPSLPRLYSATGTALLRS